MKFNWKLFGHLILAYILTFCLIELSGGIIMWGNEVGFLYLVGLFAIWCWIFHIIEEEKILEIKKDEKCNLYTYTNFNYQYLTRSDLKGLASKFDSLSQSIKGYIKRQDKGGWKR